jgi:hypothetical protein
MVRFDIAAIITAVRTPLQLAALALILIFLFAALAWLNPRPRLSQASVPAATTSGSVAPMSALPLNAASASSTRGQRGRAPRSSTGHGSLENPRYEVRGSPPRT